jgi:hypothetical protein
MRGSSTHSCCRRFSSATSAEMLLVDEQVRRDSEFGLLRDIEKRTQILGRSLEGCWGPAPRPPGFIALGHQQVLPNVLAGSELTVAGVATEGSHCAERSPAEWGSEKLSTASLRRSGCFPAEPCPAERNPNKLLLAGIIDAFPLIGHWRQPVCNRQTPAHFPACVTKSSKTQTTLPGFLCGDRAEGVSDRRSREESIFGPFDPVSISGGGYSAGQTNTVPSLSAESSRPSGANWSVIRGAVWGELSSDFFFSKAQTARGNSACPSAGGSGTVIVH